MAPELQETDKTGRSTEPSTGKRPRWQSSDYNDESLLVSIRQSHPSLSWIEITSLFNSHVPPERQRTANAVTSKGSELMKAQNQFIVSAASSSHPLEDWAGDWSQVKKPCHVNPKLF